MKVTTLRGPMKEKNICYLDMLDVPMFKERGTGHFNVVIRSFVNTERRNVIFLICSSSHCKSPTIDRSKVGANKEVQQQTSASANTQPINLDAEVWVGDTGSFCPILESEWLCSQPWQE